MAFLDLETFSSICGSISIACWITVFSPQILENFQRSSAEGLSIVFVVVWLAGDVFNILGAVLQGVLPTMIILAVYYTLADIVLLAQCFYYRGFTLSDAIPPKDSSAATPLSSGANGNSTPTERTALLSSPSSTVQSNPLAQVHGRRGSFVDQIHDSLQHLDGTRLSPATPMHPGKRDEEALKLRNLMKRDRSVLASVLINLSAILVVCAAGVVGWWLSSRAPSRSHDDRPEIPHDPRQRFNVLGQVFGYVCALLYLGSRLPQLLLNYRRKSTDGISMLFFLFACVGNLTYVISIMAYKPECMALRHGHLVLGSQYCEPGEAGELYLHNFLVNLSWLLGSFGTLLLDAGVFVQFFIYRNSGQQGESAIAD